MSGRQYPDQSDSKLSQPDILADIPADIPAAIPVAEAPLSTDSSLHKAPSNAPSNAHGNAHGNALADDAWERVTNRMRQDIGEAAWRNWIKPLRVSRLEDGTLTLEASSMLARERVTSQYADRLRVISAAEYGTVRKVEISLASQQAPRMSQQKRAASNARA